MPPSTTCSHTTSAAPSPVCGRASTEFSIFTASAGRSTTASTGTPVSGQAGADGRVTAAMIESRYGTADRCFSAAGHVTNAPAVTSTTTSRAARKARPDLDRRRPFAAFPPLARVPFADGAPLVGRVLFLPPEGGRDVVDLGM